MMKLNIEENFQLECLEENLHPVNMECQQDCQTQKKNKQELIKNINRKKFMKQKI